MWTWEGVRATSMRLWLIIIAQLVVLGNHSPIIKMVMIRVIMEVVVLWWWWWSRVMVWMKVLMTVRVGDWEE